MTTKEQEYISPRSFNRQLATIDNEDTSNITIVPANQNAAKLLLNNSIRVPFSDDYEGIRYSGALNSNVYLEIKDQEDGYFKKLSVNSNSVYISGQELIRVDDLENIINDLPNAIVFNNVYINAYSGPNVGYINFLTSSATSNLYLPPQMGFRVSNGFIEYLHYGDIWRQVGSTVETFPTEYHLVTPTSSNVHIPIPIDCAGIRFKIIGGGGSGGSALPGTFGQAAGGGSGGSVNCFLTEDDILNTANIYCQFHTPQYPYGGNVSVYRVSTAGVPTLVANASGGFIGSNVVNTGGSMSGGQGGSGYVVDTFKGYVLPGAWGQSGFRSEDQNLRYYSAGAGASSALGPGGRGADPSDSNTSIAIKGQYGGGGGGGLWVTEDTFAAGNPASNVNIAGGLGGDASVVIEYWINSEPWHISNGGGGGGGSTLFRALADVSVTNTPGQRYLKYSSSCVAINGALTIIDDVAPMLGGNLVANGNHIQFQDNTGLLDATGNLALAISSTDSSNSYLVAKSSRLLGGEEVGEITVDNVTGDLDVGIAVSAKGAGDITITTTGIIQMAATQVDIDNTTAFNINSGHIKTSVGYYYDPGSAVSPVLSTNSGSPTIINAENVPSIILLQIAGNDGRYYLNLTSGVNGQHVNFVYETNGANNEVNLGFQVSTSNSVAKSVGVGSGLVNGLRFAISGQASQLAYIQLSNVSNGYTPSQVTDRSRWQVLNSGAFTY